MKRASVVAWLVLAVACSPSAAEQDDSPGTSAVTTLAPPAVPTSSEPPPTTSSTTAVPPPTVPLPVPDLPRDWYLAWSSGRLEDDFAATLAALAGVDMVSVVHVGLAHLVPSTGADAPSGDVPADGFVFPLETFIVDPATYGNAMSPSSARALATLGPGEVGLGASSAELRDLGPGDTMELRPGGVVTVGAVFPDEHVGAAEVVTTDASLVPSAEPRFVVFHHVGDPATLARDLAGAYDYPVRLAGRGDTPYFRHGDSVLPQVAVKLRFGEFAFRPGPGARFTIDPAWLEANIVTVDLPLLGVTRCHRDVADLVDQAMEQLVEMGRADVIDPSAFAGCWNPRFIAQRRGISRHAWGAAVDINIFNPLDGPGSPVDRALVDVMSGLGFTNGSMWLSPDPGHFEWYGDDPPS